MSHREYLKSRGVRLIPLELRMSSYLLGQKPFASFWSFFSGMWNSELFWTLSESSRPTCSFSFCAADLFIFRMNHLSEELIRIVAIYCSIYDCIMIYGLGHPVTNARVCCAAWARANPPTLRPAVWSCRCTVWIKQRKYGCGTWVLELNAWLIAQPPPPLFLLFCSLYRAISFWTYCFTIFNHLHLQLSSP